MHTDIYFSEWEDLHELPGGELITACITYPATLTTEHATSSYGQPVVVIAGTPHGPGDMPPGELQLDPATVAAAGAQLTALGYRWQPLDPASFTGDWAQAQPAVGHWHSAARYVQY